MEDVREEPSEGAIMKRLFSMLVDRINAYRLSRLRFRWMYNAHEEGWIRAYEFAKKYPKEW